jgi:hypothetical protein
MKCDKVKTFLPSYAARSLKVRHVRGIDVHLQDCADCQKSLEKTRKLQSLLAFKREEKPDEFFLRNFLPEFHRRLYSDYSDVVQKYSLWSQIREFFSLDKKVHYFFRVSSGVALLVISLSFGTVYFLKNKNVSHSVAAVSQSNVDSVVEVEAGINQLVVSNNQSQKGSVYVLDRVTYEPSTHGPVVLSF